MVRFVSRAADARGHHSLVPTSDAGGETVYDLPPLARVTLEACCCLCEAAVMVPVLGQCRDDAMCALACIDSAHLQGLDEAGEWSANGFKACAGADVYTL